MYWSKEKRENAAELFEQGMGYKAVATHLGISPETARDWSYTWRALGREGLTGRRGRHEYPPHIKLACARARIEEGASMVETMERFGVFNRGQIKRWCNMYEKKGEAAFKP